MATWAEAMAALSLIMHLALLAAPHVLAAAAGAHPRWPTAAGALEALAGGRAWLRAPVAEAAEQPDSR